MLLQLQIQNIALIDKLNIELGGGLNILTGETGAGKSIIIDSINAILGERLSKEIIRTGAEKAGVEAVFQVDNAGFADIFEKLGIDPEEDGTLILSREFSLSGKNTCRINGKMATVSMLRELGERLIDVHGQHDNQSLLRTESHIELLDSFAGESVKSLKQEYTKLLEKFRTLKAKIKDLSGDRGERERKIDLLRYQIEEIKKARLKPGEEEELNRQRLALSNAERIAGALSNAYELLYSGNNIKSSASDNISAAMAELNGITKLGDKFGKMYGKLEELSYQLDDVIEDIRRERDGVEFNPEMLEQIEERLDVICRLKRKYGNSVEDVMDYCRRAEGELEDIIKSEEKIEELNKQVQEIGNSLYGIAERLNAERRKAAEILEERISAELEDLEMKKAKFKVSIDFDGAFDASGERRYGQNGLDRVEFLISPNVGEPLKPLSKIASGGEMSRIMLAIKTILAKVDNIPTLIFDEIDIGVSGKTAQKVGEKLSYISKNHQVLCVTHLAQIACMADTHFLIEKHSGADSTVTHVKCLDAEGVRKEIARILGGANISDITLKHAEEVLDNAKKIKTAAEQVNH